ncbi:MAG: hypothetical protein BWY91_02822 [bacterium ADurb.BinA028]|nr:MAG: hypothetical protein BWY91_02822 [bacterium ADurb.BinA028]
MLVFSATLAVQVGLVSPVAEATMVVKAASVATSIS